MVRVSTSQRPMGRRDFFRVISGGAVLLAGGEVLAGCGGGDGSASAVNPFVNTFNGKVAMRDANQQLTGDFATTAITVTANNKVSGTVSLASGSIADSVKRGAKVYSHTSSPTRASPDGTIAVTGSADPKTGIFTATGSGNDVDGTPVTVSVQGTPQQLNTSQLATTTIMAMTSSATTSGTGVLKGSVQSATLPSTKIPPLLTGDASTGVIRIPQGATVRFAATGTDQPANPDQTETGDVVNFSLSNYHSPGFDGYSNIDSGGWLFSYDGTYFTLKVPDDAPITTGYEVRDRSTGNPVSANFTVIKPVVTVFFGGAGDNSMSQIVKSYEADFATAHSSVLVMYYTYTDEDDAIALINNMSAKCRINLVGHSYGGDTAATVATKAGRKIDLLITIDPVSYFGARYATVKNSSVVWYDTNATAGGSFGDLVAGFGSAWNSGPKKYIPSTYFEVPVHHEDFALMLNSNGIYDVLDQASK